MGPNVLINFIISPVLRSKVGSLFSVSKVTFVGRELLLTIRLHCLLKKSLNKITFPKKLVTSRLSTESDGIREILEPFTKAFKIEQKVLAPVLVLV